MKYKVQRGKRMFLFFVLVLLAGGCKGREAPEGPETVTPQRFEIYPGIGRDAAGKTEQYTEGKKWDSHPAMVVVPTVDFKRDKPNGEPHAEGCFSRNLRIECTGPFTKLAPASGTSHFYGYDENGNPLYCELIEVWGPHEVYCGGCGVYFGTEIRMQKRLHSRCSVSAQTGMCKNDKWDERTAEKYGFYYPKPE